MRCTQLSSWRNRLARSTVNREVVGSIPTEDAYFASVLMIRIYGKHFSHFMKVLSFNFIQSFMKTIDFILLSFRRLGHDAYTSADQGTKKSVLGWDRTNNLSINSRTR